jgi:hypothetical protein
MFNFNQSKKFLAIVGCAVAGLLSFSGVQAANPETVTAEVAFVAPILIATNNPLQYGLLDVAMVAGNTVTVTTAGGTADPQLRIVGGTQAAADLDVTATASQPINILADNPTNGGGAYSLGTFLCDYAGGGPLACGGGGLDTTSDAIATATLLIGATLTGVGVPVAGTFNGSFDVTVSYQ